jgi:hypothetical protein
MEITCINYFLIDPAAVAIIVGCLNRLGAINQSLPILAEARGDAKQIN